MPRPKKNRCLNWSPNVMFFKPRGIPVSKLEEIILNRDELEALRLCDALNKDQVEAAEIMTISQSTLQRTLSSARKKTATAISEGMAIKIE